MADANQHLTDLIEARDSARAQFFAHRDPGNLTPSQKSAFKYRNMALLLLLKAAQLELDAELQLHALMIEDNAAWDAQIEMDARNGKLDALFAKSLEDFNNGHFKEI